MSQSAQKDKEQREIYRIEKKFTNIVDSWQLVLAITTRQSDKGNERNGIRFTE